MIKVEVMVAGMVAGANGEDMSVMMGGVRKIGTRSGVNCARLVCHLILLPYHFKYQ